MCLARIISLHLSWCKWFWVTKKYDFNLKQCSDLIVCACMYLIKTKKNISIKTEAQDNQSLITLILTGAQVDHSKSSFMLYRNFSAF